MAVDFWAFSLLVYAEPGVAPACLALQDGAGADVNLLLFALWAAHCGRELSGALAAELDRAVAPWRTGVVRPLREVRRALKGAGADALRAQVVAAERDAERHQQAMMEAWLPRCRAVADPDLAARNLAAIAGLAGLAWPGDAVAVLAAAIRNVRASPE